MQQERQQPSQSQPPAYTQHDPHSLNLPSVPTHTLPSLRSLDLPDAHRHHARGTSMEVSPKSTTAQWGQIQSLHSAAFPRVPDGDIGSPMDTCSVVSATDDRLREMSVSVDDPDVRLAAEALSGLGNPGTFEKFGQSWPEPQEHAIYTHWLDTCANKSVHQTLPAPLLLAP